MSELVRRQDVDEAIKRLCDMCGEDKKYGGVMCGACNLDNFIRVWDDIPSAEHESFDWCTRGEQPCKEYDYEHHCCHRWTSFIRKTVEDMKLVHCNECFYAESVDDKEDGYRCRHEMNAYRSVIWFGGDYCSYGEKKNVIID